MSARTARAARPTGRRRLAVAGLVAVVFGLLGSLGLEAALRLRRTGGLAMPPSYWVADDELIYRPNFAHPETPGPWRRREAWSGSPPEHRVVCLGGSTTFGYGVEWNETWPHYAEQALAERGIRAELLNAGVNGYGSRQLLIWYRRELAKIDADTLVLWAGWNRTGAVVDAGEWWPPTTPRPGEPRLRTVLGWAASRSMGLARLRALAERATFESNADDFELDRYHEVWIEDVTALVRAAQARGQQVFLVIYPALYRADMTDAERAAVDGRFFMEKTFDPEMLVELERKHQAIRDIAAREGARLVDLQGALDGIRGAERDALFLDEAHLGPAGNALAGRVIAEALAPVLDARAEDR